MAVGLLLRSLVRCCWLPLGAVVGVAFLLAVAVVWLLLVAVSAVGVGGLAFPAVVLLVLACCCRCCLWSVGVFSSDVSTIAGFLALSACLLWLVGRLLVWLWCSVGWCAGGAVGGCFASAVLLLWWSAGAAGLLVSVWVLVRAGGVLLSFQRLRGRAGLVFRWSAGSVLLVLWCWWLSGWLAGGRLSLLLFVFLICFSDLRKVKERK